LRRDQISLKFVLETILPRLEVFIYEVKGLRRAIIFAVFMVVCPVIAVGQTGHAPTLVLKDIRGRTVRLSDYKGKVVLLNFWATWCPPCRAEMPDLIKMQREFRSKGLRVIGVTYLPEEIGKVRQFVRKLRVNYPIALGTKEIKTLFDETETLPVTIVIDRQGNVRERIEGILLPVEFEQRIKPLLK
jgi:thiol-disulfide isomerase/thioredoxin